MNEANQACDTLATLGRAYYARGWVPATAGNFSIRLASGQIVMTRSGVHKGRLESSDFIRLDTLGQPLGMGTPSAEAGLHLALYQRWPELHCILHTHSPKATAISRLQPEHIKISGYEVLKAFEGINTHEANIEIPIVENDQDISSLSARVNARLEKQAFPPGYLIRGHGLYTWGRDPAAADRHLEALEFLFECELLVNRQEHT